MLTKLLSLFSRKRDTVDQTIAAIRALQPHYLILTDGFPTLLNVIDTPGIFGVVALEKTLTPMGISHGGMIDVTTMRNILWRTRNPKKLMTLTEVTIKVAYDPIAIGVVLQGGGSGRNTWMVFSFPDTSFIGFWGFIDEFVPDEVKEGDQPMASMKITPSGHDNTAPVHVERDPVYVGPGGTTPPANGVV